MKLLLLILIVFFNISYTPCIAQSFKKYSLVWSDEFNGTELDTDKWSYRALGPRRDAVNVIDCVYLDGKGNLVITTKKAGNEYYTGMIGTQGKFEVKYGYFECRVKLQTQIGHWSAFWLQSPKINMVGDPEVNGTEIDIFEYLVAHKDTVFTTLHWNGYGKEHKSLGTKYRIPGLNKGFHTFGLKWTPKEYIFYVDGKEVWKTDEAVSHTKQYIILSLEVGKWAGDIKNAKLPDSVYFDYVRVYSIKKD